MRVEQPVRVRRTFRQSLAAAPASVFPLLCPVRERDWVPGWDPPLVITRSGFAERDAVFTTLDGDRESVWYTIEFDPPRRIAFVKVTPGVVATRITITLEPDGATRSFADVEYEYTALGTAGRDLVASMTAERYGEFMAEWEDQLNRYLTGAP
jgi:hypothetical protein